MKEFLKCFQGISLAKHADGCIYIQRIMRGTLVHRQGKLNNCLQNYFNLIFYIFLLTLSFSTFSVKLLHLLFLLLCSMVDFWFFWGTINYFPQGHVLYCELYKYTFCVIINKCQGCVKCVMCKNLSEKKLLVQWLSICDSFFLYEKSWFSPIQQQI